LWTKLKPIYYELGRPNYPKQLLTELDFRNEAKRTNKLIGSGFKADFIFSMSREARRDLYNRTFGGRKVKTFSPTLEIMHPYFDENKVTKEWIHFNEKSHSKSENRSRVIYKVFKVREHVVKELSFVELKQFLSFKYTTSKGIIKRKFYMISSSKDYLNMSFPNISTFSVVKRAKVLSDELKGVLPVKTNKDTLFMGLTPFKVSGMPQTVLAWKEETKEFLKQHGSELAFNS